MKLDKQYIERIEAIERDIKAGIGLYGYIGHQAMPEGEDFGKFLAGKGVAYQERVLSAVGTWYDHAHELHYQRLGQGRYAYLLMSHPDVDVWSQDVYIFSQAVPESALAATISMVRQQEKDLDQFVEEQQREIDKEYPAYWRLINNNWEMSVIAYHLVHHGWTPQVERILAQWGAYNTIREGTGLENVLVKSLLEYGKLIMAQDDPESYVQDLLDRAGQAGRQYRGLL